MNFIKKLKGNDKSRRLIVVWIRYKYNKFYAMDYKLLKEVITLAVKYNIQTTISFNTNNLNPIHINLNEYCLYYQYYSKNKEELKKSWGNQIDFLRKIAEKYEPCVLLGGEKWVYRIRKNFKIIEKWIPGDGG